VLGGVTTFLFASVATSGLRVLSYVKWQRRDRFILGAALSFGIGDLIVPGIFEHLFDKARIGKNSGLTGFFDSITILLSTPFLIAGVVAVMLNLTLPEEKDDREGIVEMEENGRDIEQATPDDANEKPDKPFS